jgi:hypothetical protein
LRTLALGALPSLVAGKNMKGGLNEKYFIGNVSGYAILFHFFGNFTGR